MNKNRPVNLDISTLKLPITAYASILHRISGVFLLLGVAVLLWMLDTSLSSQEGFNQVKECLSSPVAKAVLWFVLVGLGYHMIAGVRHLLMDLGLGETLEGGRLGARIVIVLAIVQAIFVGIWLW
ncbi:succinate dehydrogenase, cytochrome b556 subunit [uncultured Umboniibacter sp.]|uniref:succinate dehydrogenase, cytochrome b556 subunit n=1 Tax=uncultured Umboniibacter sp. TaxID=1798917 RepID=UPI00261C659E|nr:succinate dehydrogenase, cytochrome b556 subunit [uncultured Umboniibacter sp.]